MFVALLFLLLCSLGCVSGHGGSSNNDEYNPMVVTFHLEILRLVGVNNVTAEADFECILKMMWNPWALKNIGGPSNPALGLLWRPDVISYKSSSAEFSDSNVSYESGFDVTWTQKLRTRVPCEIIWPSHDFHCQISFTSRSHDLYTLSLRGADIFLRYPDDETSLEQSGFRVWSSGLINSARKDPCCEKRVHVITFPVNLIRKRLL